MSKPDLNFNLLRVNSMQQLSRIFELAFFTPMGNMFSPTSAPQWGPPLVVVADPGVGKTGSMRALTRRLRQTVDGVPNQPVEMLSFEPGAMGEAAVGVTPVPSEHRIIDGHPMTTMEFPPLGRLVTLSARNKAGIFYVDEMNTARGQVKDALLTLLQQGKIGDFYMNPRIRRFASMNPPEQTSSGEIIPPPVANRLMWLYYSKPTAGEFSDYLSAGGGLLDVEQDAIINVEEREQFVLSNWVNYWPETVGLIAGWLNAQPGYLHQMPDLDNPQVSAAWPSPRSLEMLARLLTTSRMFNVEEADVELIATGCVGAEAASALATYKLHNKDIPNIQDLLDGKVPYVPTPARLDIALAVVTGCVSHLLMQDAPTFNRQVRQYFKIAQEIVPFGADILMRGTKAVFKQATKLKGASAASKEALELLQKMHPITCHAV